MDRKRTGLHEVEHSSLPAIPHFRYFQNAAGNPANGHQDPGHPEKGLHVADLLPILLPVKSLPSEVVDGMLRS